MRASKIVLLLQCRLNAVCRAFGYKLSLSVVSMACSLSDGFFLSGTSMTILFFVYYRTEVTLYNYFSYRVNFTNLPRGFWKIHTSPLIVSEIVLPLTFETNAKIHL